MSYKTVKKSLLLRARILKIEFMPNKSSQTNITYPSVKLGDILRAFWRGMKKYKWWLFTVIFSIVLLSVVSAIAPLFYKQFFDAIATGGDKSQTAKHLVSIIIIIAALNATIWLFWRIATYASNIFQAFTIAELKRDAYDYVMQHSYGYFSNTFTGSIVQRINRYARAFERLTDRIFTDVLSLAVRMIVIIIVVTAINPAIAAILVVWAAVFLLFNVTFSKWKLRYDVKVAEVDSQTTGFLADTVTNHNTVQLFTGRIYESRNWNDLTEEQAKITRLNWDLNSIIEAGQAFLGFIIEFLLFYFAIHYWEKGLITIGVFVLLQSYILILVDQLWNFTRVVRDIYQCYADAKEMVEIMLLPHEIADVPHPKTLAVKQGQIELRGLNFCFNETREVLKNINFVIKPGEKVALVGPSGAGKTTLVRLLLRLYIPTEGQILIDGQDIAGAAQDDLRSNIAMVPQDPVLFHRTVAENIAYGKRDASMEEIKRAGKLAHCDEFVNELSYGFDTYVGERGIKLSGGERQRVAIARAILKNAPILVLDEATSSLDSHSESLIQDALNTLMASRTTIVIAHRLSTVQKMDRIIVLDNGKIVETGSHNELLAKDDSLYRKLWSLQVGGFLSDNLSDKS